MAGSNLLVNDRIVDKAVGTFVSVVSKTMPDDADYKVRKQVKDNAWRVVAGKHPTTIEWRRAYNEYMTRCNGVRGLGDVDAPMSDTAKLWKRVINTAGGSMNGMYAKNGNTELVKPSISIREVNGRNITVVNRVKSMLETWVLEHDSFPNRRTLAHFTGFEVPLWDAALKSLRDKGYVISDTAYGYAVIQRPPDVSKDEVSEYIKALPKQDRIELLAELIGS